MQIPNEAERLVDNDLVLELYPSPASPLLAGFRLDAFSAIRPRVTHSSGLDASVRDDSLYLLDERYINPAVLYIRVSVLQVTVACVFSLILYHEFLQQYDGIAILYLDKTRPWKNCVCSISVMVSHKHAQIWHVIFCCSPQPILKPVNSAIHDLTSCYS